MMFLKKMLGAMNKYHLIIPSWLKNSPEIQFETGCQFPLEITLGGIPLYKHIIGYYLEKFQNLKVTIVFPLDGPELDFTSFHNCSINIKRIEKSSSIGESILNAFDEFFDKSSNVIINMADTLIDNFEFDRSDVVYVKKRKDIYRWTSISDNGHGNVLVFDDRSETYTKGLRNVCTGVFSFSNTSLISDLLAKFVNDTKDKKVDSFFLAIQEYSNSKKIDLLEVPNWIDCGHLDTFYESKFQYLNLRHFNSLEYDSKTSTIVKKSTNLDSFRHQIRWFNQVPKKIEPFLPRIYDFDDGNSPFIKMEFLSYPTLSDLFISQRLSVGEWNSVTESLINILTEFNNHKFHSDISSIIFKKVYIDKTTERLNTLLAQNPKWDKLWILNNQKWFIKDVLNSINEVVEAYGLLNPKALNPIHGDFCFTNLLYDNKTKLIKMIDPRGEFGLPGIYGDSRYDYAKLFHSFDGGYDFIINNKFNVNVENSGEIMFNVNSSNYHEKVKKIILSQFSLSNKETDEIELIESLLFLSMLPLHSDSPQKQLAMLATGLNKYSNCFLKIR
jgi:hypothetical protein